MDYYDYDVADLTDYGEDYDESVFSDDTEPEEPSEEEGTKKRKVIDSGFFSVSIKAKSEKQIAFLEKVKAVDANGPIPAWLDEAVFTWGQYLDQHPDGRTPNRTPELSWEVFESLWEKYQINPAWKGTVATMATAGVLNQIVKLIKNKGFQIEFEKNILLGDWIESCHLFILDCIPSYDPSRASFPAFFFSQSDKVLRFYEENFVSKSASYQIKSGRQADVSLESMINVDETLEDVFNRISAPTAVSAEESFLFDADNELLNLMSKFSFIAKDSGSLNGKALRKKCRYACRISAPETHPNRPQVMPPGSPVSRPLTV